MKILLIDDEKHFAQSLKKGLLMESYQVDLGFNGATAISMAEKKKYDLIILDIMLPGIDGFKVCERLRKQDIQTPILMLTARDKIEDRVKGLDCGADDYLTKPFSLGELLARMRALLRRPQETKPPIFKVGGLVLDPAAHEVKRGGKMIYLTRTEYMILHYLITHKNQVITRQQLEQHIWVHSFAARNHPVNVYIRYLRRKIDDPFPRKLIKTVRGLGYKIQN